MTVESFTNAASCRYVVPEIALAIGAVLVVAWDLFAPARKEATDRDLARRRNGALAITLAALSVSAVASARMLVAKNAPARLLFDGQLAGDGYASGFRLFFALVTVFVVVAAIPTREARFGPHGRGAAGGELFAMLLAVCLGMNLMAMGRTLLTLYVGVELVSFVSFGLAALRLDPGDEGRRKSSEGALKYAVFGAVASGVMLYGMSWVYGATQSIALPEIADKIASLAREQGHLPNALAVGLACVVAGLVYKAASVPFHMWAPDVYEASPTLVSAFFAVGPQVAGLGAFLRFYREGFGAPAALPEWQAPWPILAGGLALVTMTVGTLGALGQTNLKRLLAYAGVAQGGTMLLAFSAPGEEGVAAVAFYLVPYAAVSLGAFLVVLAVSEATGSDSVDALRGLGARAPGMAAALTVFLLSLVGVPPFAGFVSKLYVIAALLRSAGDFRSFYFSLAIVGVGNTVVSLAFCARILRAMYLAPAPPGEGGRVSVPRLYAVLTAAMVVPTVFLGVWWAPLYDFVTRTVTMIP